MKIFSWMLNKRNSKPNIQEPMSHHNMMQHHCKEEYSDWPNGLLTIGTLGHSDNLSITANKDDRRMENTTSQQDNFEEEVVDRELRLLLNNHISLDSSTVVEKFLDCLREDEEKAIELLEQQKGAKDGRLNYNKKNGIGKKSLSFLLKKAFLCRGGFVLRDPLPDAKVDNSRMDKILRALLHKKIYPQRPTRKSGSKKYLDMPENDSDEEEYSEACRQSKWVKTDSEYIVLEI